MPKARWISRVEFPVLPHVVGELGVVGAGQMEKIVFKRLSQAIAEIHGTQRRLRPWVLGGWFFRACSAVALFVFSMSASAVTGYAGTVALRPIARPMFTVDLPGARMLDSSITVGDLYGDGRTCIVVGGGDGMVYAVGPDGQLLWSFSTADAINSAGVANHTPTRIRSAPTLADINRDGRLEVIVGVGEVFEAHQNGGLVVLSHDGRLLWLKLTLDNAGAGTPGPDGYTDGIVSTPAVGDIDNDGQLEIVVGSFDEWVYAWHADGTLVSGWPVWLFDTTWSSPALGDIDRDGFLEVIIGCDAGDVPWVNPPRTKGGYVEVFKHDGQRMAGWPQHIDLAVTSSPAVGDLNGDGWLEIVVGTGQYSEDAGRHISAYVHTGQLLWRTYTGGKVAGSPAIGDLNGDGALDVAVGAQDGLVYVLNGANGTLLWSRSPSDIFGNASGPVTNPILADVDGDGKADVLIASGWEVIPLRGYDGAQLDNSGAFYTDYLVPPTPAVADLDKDGKLELIAGGGSSGGAHGKVYVWKLQNSNSSRTAPWPMFHRNARHTGLVGTVGIASLPLSLTMAVPEGGSTTRSLPITDGDGGTLRWTLSSYPKWLTPNKTAGTTPDTLQVSVDGTYAEGTFLNGTMTINVDGLSPKVLPVSMLVPRSTAYLPTVQIRPNGG